MQNKTLYASVFVLLLLVMTGWVLWELPSEPRTPGEAPVVPAVSMESVVAEPVADIALTDAAQLTPIAVSQAALTLRGVFASPERALSLAIIANDAGVERYFLLEDTVFDAAILKEIHQYHVVILRNGLRRVLRLSRDAAEWAEAPSQEAQRGRLLADYRQAILSGDFEKFIGVAGYKPAYKGSNFYGFEIVSQGKKGDAFLGQIGLQQGDVVTSINSHDLATDFEYMQYLAKNIKTLSEVNLGVEREGTILFFTYTTDSAAGAGDVPVTENAATQEKSMAPVNTVLEGLLEDDQ